MFMRSLAMAAMVLAIGTAVADDNSLTSLDKQQFASYDAQIRADLQAGMRYKEISPADQDDLLKTLTQMEVRWQRADANGKLNANDSVEMANDEQVISTILHHASVDSRVICDREVPMGTKVAVNKCRTVAQIRREQNEAQSELRDMQKQGAGTGGH